VRSKIALGPAPRIFRGARQGLPQFVNRILTVREARGTGAEADELKLSSSVALPSIASSASAIPFLTADIDCNECSRKGVAGCVRAVPLDRCVRQRQRRRGRVVATRRLARFWTLRGRGGEAGNGV